MPLREFWVHELLIVHGSGFHPRQIGVTVLSHTLMEEVRLAYYRIVRLRLRILMIQCFLPYCCLVSNITTISIASITSITKVR